MEDVVMPGDFMADSMHAPKAPAGEMAGVEVPSEIVAGEQAAGEQAGDWEDVDEVI
jgi:hypothetical protein